MKLRRLRLRNWMCFRGEHEIVFKDGAHAISAIREADVEYSNASGKTAFCSAPGFALWGEHPLRLDDEWISRGEKDGFVEIECDDGTIIKRARTLGSSTKLIVKSGGQEFTRDPAEDRIYQLLGIDKTDFFATRHLAQRKVAELLFKTPEQRMIIVATWVNLGPLEEATKRASELLESVAIKVDEQQREYQRWQDRIAHALGDYLIQATPMNDREAAFKLLEQAQRDSAAHVGRLKEDVSLAERALANAEAHFVHKDAHEKFDEIRKRGDAIQAEIEELDSKELVKIAEQAKDRVNQLSLLWGQKDTRVKQLTAPAKGEFDGSCPISLRKCPVQKEINDDRVAARAQHSQAFKEREKVDLDLRQARRAADDADANYQSYTRKKEQLHLLRSQGSSLQGLAESFDGSKDVDVPARRKTVEAMTEKYQAAVAENGNLVWRIASYKDALLQIEEIEKKRKILQRAERIASRAVLIFGRSGAQRRVAETALVDIEERANEALAVANVDLQVAVRWEREGQGLATACEACGHPFPSSMKVKECSRCHAKRGPRITHRLDIVLSDRSGGLDDFAGLMISLGAGGWLREHGTSDCGFIIVDEAWGQLDARHRKNLSAALPRMLPLWGAEQAFFTAHHSAVLDAMPHRIEIDRLGEWSSVRIVG